MFIINVMGRGNVALCTSLIISAMFVQQYLLSEEEASVHRFSYVDEEQYFIDRKIVCPSLQKIKFNVTSILQCLHRCANRERCGISNYRHGDDERPDAGKCVIYDLPDNFQVTHENCQLVVRKGWVALLPKNSLAQRDSDDHNEPIYKTCDDLQSHSNTETTGGVYDLVDGRHWCMMNDNTKCGNGGWTLAMTINGEKETFSVESQYWSNNETYNVENGIESYYAEAKFPAFSLIPFNSVCVGMLLSNETRWLRLNISATSLREVFKDNNYIKTTLGRSAWKGLGPQPSLQSYCNKEGFNVRDSRNKMYARIGIIANQEDNCGSPDSFIGFGTLRDKFCNAELKSISCGNHASCEPDNGEKSIPAICYILIQ